MSQYQAKISWQRQADENFSQSEYSRGHEWAFDGGVTVPASSSPSVVPLPYSVEANVDPEEALVAAISSCHMLTFLSIAAKRKFIIDSYVDDALGTMEKNEQGRLWISRVELRPDIVFSGDKKPTSMQIEKMHEMSHDQCFIANSVKTEVTVEVIE